MRNILQSVRNFKSRAFQPRRQLFQKLGAGQSPRACLITCVDSRICTNLLTDSEPGDVFVIRNAGNLVPPAGNPSNAEEAALEIAISVGVEDIIICGHSHCGAMKGLFDAELPHRSPAINDWLRHARPAGKRAINQSPELEGDDLIWEVVKENVLLQLKNLRSLPCVSRALAKGQIKLHGWAYRIETGDILAYDDEAQIFESVGLPQLPVVA